MSQYSIQVLPLPLSLSLSFPLHPTIELPTPSFILHGTSSVEKNTHYSLDCGGQGTISYSSVILQHFANIQHVVHARYIFVLVQMIVYNTCAMNAVQEVCEGCYRNPEEGRLWVHDPRFGG